MNIFKIAYFNSIILINLTFSYSNIVLNYLIFYYQ